MAEATFTFRVEEELKAAFTAAAKEEERTGAQLLRAFMKDYVRRRKEAADHDAWFRREAQIGLDAAESGDLISSEEVEAEAATWRAQLQRRKNGKPK